MLKLILVLFICLLNFEKTIGCVAQWAQCGGINYSGATDCCQSSSCVIINPWYSQCIPSSSPSTTGCSALYSQCGGQDWTGPTCCDNSVCVYSNPYYSQCLQGQPSSTSSSSTTPSSSSSSTSSSSSSSSSTSSSSSASSSTTSQSTGCNTVYSQCGGQNWSGSQCCIASTCVYSNPYYSQCLPSSASSSSSSSTNSVSSTTATTANDGRLPGVTTRYWDCCKASCGWQGKAYVTNPVATCARDGVTIVASDTQSGCTGGTGYMCNNQQPWNVSSTLSYGYAAAHIAGQIESNWCCACYSLIFTSGPVIGKELIVQVTNTGGDLGNNHFDLQMPGGGVGIFDGCSSQFPGPYSWGQRYGGISQRSECANLPAVLQPGCYWRFDWFMNADNPSISFKQVSCPSVLTANTNCIRL